MSNDIEQSKRISSAVARGDVAEFDRLLNESPDLFRYEGGTCMWLSAAADAGHVGILEYLYQKGVDVNEPYYPSDEPEGVIRTAAGRGHYEATRWLIDHGAVLNHTVDGKTRCFALSSASRRGHLKIVQLLIERGAEVNSAWAGLTPLDFAIGYGKEEVVEYLRSLGAKTGHDLGEPDCLSDS